MSLLDIQEKSIHTSFLVSLTSLYAMSHQDNSILNRETGISMGCGIYCRSISGIIIQSGLDLTLCFARIFSWRLNIYIDLFSFNKTAIAQNNPKYSDKNESFVSVILSFFRFTSSRFF